MMTRAQAVRAACDRLIAAGVDDPEKDVWRLMVDASALGSVCLITEMTTTIPVEEQARFWAHIERRVRREPLSQILGLQSFWTLELKVSSDVLAPRSDTEVLVDAALAVVSDRDAPLKVLDIATGSGAIMLALLSELQAAQGVGTDLSAPALAIAAENVRRCGFQDRVQLVRTRWAGSLEASFDLVVSNPPYIASAVVDTLEPEVRDHEPRLALDGGVDGLASYPYLLGEARRLLKPGGWALFEIGYDQGVAVQALVEATGVESVEILPDLAGRDRVVRIRYDQGQTLRAEKHWNCP